MAQLCQILCGILCLCAVDTIGNTDDTAIHCIHCRINRFTRAGCNLHRTAALCAIAEDAGNRAHHVLYCAAYLCSRAAQHVSHACRRACPCQHCAANRAQTTNVFLHIHNHQHPHEFRSQQLFFGNVHFICEYRHRQCGRNALVAAAAEGHNRAVAAAHTEVRRCRRNTSDCCHNVSLQHALFQ